MIDRYVALNRHLRTIATRCRDAIDADAYDDKGYVQGLIADYVQRDVRDILHAWPVDLENAVVRQIGQQVGQTGLKRETFQEVLTASCPGSRIR